MRKLLETSDRIGIQTKLQRKAIHRMFQFNKHLILIIEYPSIPIGPKLHV